MRRIDEAREKSTIPWNLTSGYRCEEYDNSKEINGDGNHPTGEALDIAIRSGSERFKILEILINSGFNRIGIGSDFIHVDQCYGRPNNVVWTYKAKKEVIL